MKKLVLFLLILFLTLQVYAIGGDNFATAVQITALPYNDTGDTSTLTNTIANSSADAFYHVNSIFDLTNVTIDLTGSSFDTYLRVYDSSQNQLWADDDGGSGTASMLSGLTFSASTDYYICVEGYSSNVGAYVMNVSADQSGSLVDATAPGLIDDVLPANGSNDLSLTTSIGWTFGTNTETYDLYFDIVNPPVTMVVNDAVAGATGSYDPGMLTEYTVYYWRVVSRNAITRLEISNPVYNFSTIDMAPLNVSNEVPLDGSANQALDIQLSWDFAVNAETYDLFFDTVDPPVAQVVTDGVASIGGYNPGTLTENTVYYWNVVSKNTASLRTTSDLFSFTTILGANITAIGTGTLTNVALPIEPYYGYSYSQCIYLQSEIDRTNQRIEKIWYHYNQNGTLATSQDWVIYMGHTADVAFATSSSWVPLANLTEVFNGTLPTIPAD
ncbi:MAG: hypothetical protein P9L91_09575, partial [Candidatus Zophobacter franzmannii]|nr:hypothetical protein [Candidatus Zophobacter franzmannii]